MIGFENQLSTQSERDLFFCFELNTRCCKDKADLENTIACLIESKPELKGADWFSPLYTDFLNYVEQNHSKDELYTPSVSSYLRAVLDKYSGTLTFWKPDNFKGLKAFTEDELAQPHMRWIKCIDAKRSSLQKELPDLRVSSAIAMARYCEPCEKKLSSDELHKLFKFFYSCDCNHMASMDFSDWANWFIKTRDMFDTNSFPLPEFGEQIKQSLEKRKQESLSEQQDWVEYRFEIHPFYEEAILNWLKSLR